MDGDGVLVSQQELREALRRKGYTDFSRELVRDVLDHREAEWQAGDVVKDARGVLWKRVTDGSAVWLKFGSAARFNHNVPVRPLKKAEI